MKGRTLVDLLRSERVDGSLWAAVALLLPAWLGVNAIWGITSSSDTVVSGLERRLAPLEVWLAVTASLLVLVFGISTAKQSRELMCLAAILLAYMAGVFLGRYLTVNVVLPAGGNPPVPADALWWVVRRTFLLVPALPMLTILWVIPDWRISELPLRFGDWSVSTLFFQETATPKSWFKLLGIWLLLAVLPIALLMQGSVGFRPILSGKLWPFLAPLLLLAALNAFSEELLFRGLLQPVLIRYLGVGAGIWVQAAFFGIHHWGASPDAISGLPTALIIGILGLVWGKSTYETGGLGWAICIHMAVDLSFFSAHFVPGE